MDSMEQPKLSEELRKMEYEPLLPVEKRLVGWSIVVGLVLVGLLAWINSILFRT
jgi:hypothetical protein